MRVLVIEDSPKMSAALEKGLREHGFSVDHTASGEDGEELAAVEQYDAIVLDLMLPDRDGLDVCRNLRRRQVDTPVLILTALGDTPDKVAGFDAGADDYLPKPFEFEELIARLRALVRRCGEGTSTTLRHADMELDLHTRRAVRAGAEIELTHKEFALLEYLMRNPNRVLSRTVIGDHVWDMNFNAFSNVIDVYISNLRKKIDKPFDTPLIHTVIGAGYRFGEGDATVDSDDCADKAPA